MVKDEEKITRLEFALREHQRFNRINNDLDVYLYAMAEWALGFEEDRPIPEDFGVPKA